MLEAILIGLAALAVLAIVGCVALALFTDGEEVTATGNCEKLGGPPSDSTYGP